MPFCLVEVPDLSLNAALKQNPEYCELEFSASRSRFFPSNYVLCFVYCNVLLSPQIIEMKIRL